jgi:starch phosphorylase
MSQIAPDYTMKRMMDDYFNRFYHKLATRSAALSDHQFTEAKKIAGWKKEVAEHWDSFEVESLNYHTKSSYQHFVDDEYAIEIVINRKDLQSMLGIDLVVARENPENHKLEFISSTPFELKKETGALLYFELKTTTTEVGHLKVGIRVYPYHEKLPHRMDFAYVRWIE